MAELFLTPKYRLCSVSEPFHNVHDRLLDPMMA